MRKSLGLVSALALIGGLAASTSGSNVPAGNRISQMLASSAQAASVERQTAINASTGNYAVVTPTYLGEPGASYTVIRLFSGVGAAGSSTTSTFSLTVVGVPSGQVYGTPVNIPVPHLASFGLGLKDIVLAAGVGYKAFTNGDTGYSIYIQDPDPEAGYQHSIYNPTSGLYENMSNCGSLLNEQMVALHNEMVLANLHTAGGPGKIGLNYPSSAVIHNYYNVPTTFIVSAFNGGTWVKYVDPNSSSNGGTPNSGKLTCRLSFTVGANSSRVIPMSEIEQNSACVLDTDENYVNIVIANQTGGPPNADLAHLIHVSLYGGDTNMSDVCAVNKVTGGSTGGGGVPPISPYL